MATATTDVMLQQRHCGGQYAVMAVTVFIDAPANVSYHQPGPLIAQLSLTRFSHSITATVSTTAE